MAVSDWSIDAASNTAVDGINIDELCNPGNVNDAIRAIMADTAQIIGNATLGALPAGSSTPAIIAKSASGNSGGTTDWRGTIDVINYTGAFGAAQISRNMQHNLYHTAGTVAFAIALQGYGALGVPSTPTTTGNISSFKGIEFHLSHTGTGTVSSAHVFSAMGPDLNVGVGTVAKFHNYHSDDISGGGVSTRITTETFGFFQGNSTANGAPIMAGYGSEMSFGTGRWSLYFTGGANSAIAGRLRIGDTTAPTEFLEVAGNASLTGVYKISGTQVVAARQTGWAADTGTAKKTANATYTAGATLTYSAAYVQAEQTAMATRMAAVEAALQALSQTQKGVKDALIAHGLIGT